ncbi:hypothetical protein FRACYDRAFT_251208 [Fragilariopsis cylindrus CCMP1102]|uniref:Uncharacterized protein n=1 Tax=Fragilariopsis cylindrus CCMP1102 TaxID=635003 RepID=A0A1E7ENI2_9STRA|nr:hypothetical protein FRACYDRAFT_251208 [Fragilariopsis cylindrus CCMP1102]|eukprot:OEU07404.1 hypothetical protein FRACYDRAFT_251208 [Fragilariopsis cylindrus CCMP1102]
MSPPSDGKPKRKKRVVTEEAKKRDKERRKFLSNEKKQKDKEEAEALIEERGAQKYRQQLELTDRVAEATASSKKIVAAENEASSKRVAAENEASGKRVAEHAKMSLQIVADDAEASRQIAADDAKAGRERLAKTCTEADQILVESIQPLFNTAVPQQGDTQKVEGGPLSMPVPKSAKLKDLDSMLDETPSTPSSSTSTPSLASDTGMDVERVRDLNSTVDETYLSFDSEMGTDVERGPERCTLPVLTVELCPSQCEIGTFRRAIDYHNKFVQECRDKGYTEAGILHMLLEFGECSSQMISEFHKHPTGSKPSTEEFGMIAYIVNVVSKQVKHTNRLSSPVQDNVLEYFSGFVGMLQLSTEVASDIIESIQKCAKTSPTTRGKDFRNRNKTQSKNPQTPNKKRKGNYGGGNTQSKNSQTPNKKRKGNYGGGNHQADKIRGLEIENSLLRQKYDQEHHLSEYLQARNDYLERHRPASQSHGSSDPGSQSYGRESITPRALHYGNSPHHSQSNGRGDSRNNDHSDDRHTHDRRDD